jgi:hypothetical protein
MKWVWMAAVATMMVAVQQGDSCTVCVVVGDEIAVSHPRSLEVAVATRRAIRGGTLDPDARFSPEVELQLAARVATTVVRESQAPETRTVHLRLIDTAESHHIDLDHDHSATTRAVPADRRAMLRSAWVVPPPVEPGAENRPLSRPGMGRQPSATEAFDRQSAVSVVATRTLFRALAAGRIDLATATRDGLIVIELPDPPAPEPVALADRAGR